MSDVSSLVDLNRSSFTNGQNTESFYGTKFTGTEPTRNNEGVNGFRMTGETRYIDNITGGQKDSIKNRNRSDSLRYLNDIHRSSDSLILQKLRK